MDRPKIFPLTGGMFASLRDTAHAPVGLRPLHRLPSPRARSHPPAMREHFKPIHAKTLLIPLVILSLCTLTFSPASASEIARGVDYTKTRMEFLSGDSNVHILRIDPKKAFIHVVQARSGPPRGSVIARFLDMVFFFARNIPENPKGFGLATLSQLLPEVHGIAGVNGGFFSSDASPLGLLVMDGEVVTYPLHDRAALMIGGGEVRVGHYMVSGTCTIQGNTFQISGVNQSRSPGELILFTPRYGNRTRTYGRGLEIVVRKGVVVEQRYANSLIPEDGFVLSTRGELGKQLAPLSVDGTPITVSVAIQSIEPGNPLQVRYAIGGGPQLLRAGKVYVTKHEEHFKMDIAEGSAARTAAALTKNGELLMVVVDGKLRGSENRPKESNAGCTLEELALVLKDLGGWDALNLDGGGSSACVVQGKVVNQPVDGDERRVSNVIVIRPSLTLAEE